MIDIEDLHKAFNGREVLRGASLAIPKGEIVALMGMSGYGKSVLLKHIAGLILPDRGHVYIDGQDICHLRGEALSRLRSRLGFLFQSGALFSSMTVFDNVAFPLRERGELSEPEIRDRVLAVLDQVGLKGSEEKFPAQISGGMIKRTALARALVRNPEIMLFDEPTTGLDPVIGHAILDLIKSIHDRFGFTGMIVSHELERVFRIVQKVAMLHEGVILTVGTPQEVLSSANPIVHQFVKGEVEGPIQYR
jgi:phospholipid/cholesterol/gamma-HCH transport system ATP-binding protein